MTHRFGDLARRAQPFAVGVNPDADQQARVPRRPPGAALLGEDRSDETAQIELSGQLPDRADLVVGGDQIVDEDLHELHLRAVDRDELSPAGYAPRGRLRERPLGELPEDRLSRCGGHASIIAQNISIAKCSGRI